MDLLAVDCENCSAEMLKDLLFIKRKRHIIFVVGKGQNEENYIKMCETAECVKCNKSGKNSADFVLVALVTQMLAQNKYKRASIISNDKGFDSAIDYLRSAGFKVNRLNDKVLETNSKISQSKRKKNDVVDETELIPLCGFIAKHLKSGIGYNKFISSYSRVCGKYTNRRVEQLKRADLISVVKTKHTTQVYFSKSKLKSIAHNKNITIDRR